MSRPIKIAVLASGRGSNLQSIIAAIEERTLNASIVLVVSDKQDAFALNRAGTNKIPNLFLNPKKYSDREEYDHELAQKIRQQGADMVILAGWMRILSQKFLENFPDKVINIHPSLLPAFPGQNAQKQAFEYGVKYTGCTVHFVDSGMDTGPIIAQQLIPILADDTLEGLTDRILVEEHLLYPRVIQFFSEERIVKEGRKVRIK
ncbi:MAG: phosphoribosylglycinamide formyltransferase [Desulfitibacter sp. BRH_c19]|nr:MAG: phosphoribosylglycinamide formyltransferase [Desulfitibacter sp. BRH_c19]